MKSKSHLPQAHLRSGVLGVLCVVFPGQVHGAATLPAADGPPAQRAEAIPWSQLGARAGANYTGNGLGVSPTATEVGAVTGAQLRCVFQRLEGEATAEGLWLISTVTNQAKDRFRVIATDVRRLPTIANRSSRISNGQSLLTSAATEECALPRTGSVEVAGQWVRFIRSGLVEEYSVSMDGVRQDFIVLQKPPLTQSLSPSDGERVADRPDERELRVELAVTGAKVKPGGSGAQLVLEKSGRNISYSRLRVADATGKELPARMEVGGKSEMGLAVVVEDGDAVYPIRIDPTFSDANWMSMEGTRSVDGPVYATVVDGSGNLLIGGCFTVAGDVVANHIAKWNGSSWTALGSGMNGTVFALAVSGSDLYAGGRFTSAGGSAATNIAKWNGSGWSALGLGMDGVVRALAVSDDDLYVGGEFATAGEVSANCIARWTGSNWSALGSGMNHVVRALAVSGSDLYAGGYFTMAGGRPAFCVARWNGNSWSALGSGMSGNITPIVRALALSTSGLYAGGFFTTAGGVAATNIAKWDGLTWSALGTGINSSVSALAVSGSDLYAGGYFNTAGRVSANCIAKWNGNSWDALGSGMNDGVNALAVAGSDLFAGGEFSTAGGKGSVYLARAVLGESPGYNQLAGTQSSGGVMRFSYIGDPATSYALDRAFDLTPPISWIGQQTNTMTMSGVLLFTNTPVPGTNNFWRVRSVP